MKKKLACFCPDLSGYLRKAMLCLMLIAAFVLSGAPAMAGGRFGGHSGGYSHYRGHSHHSHSRVGIGFYFGGPYWDSRWYYPYPYYNSYYYPPYYPYYAPGPAVEAEPPVYIERNSQPEEPAPAAVWYYCPESQTYYPYVRECPGGWEKVPAQPSGTER